MKGSAAKQINAAVADVGDAEVHAVDPRGGEGGTHAQLFGMLFGGLKNFLIGEMDCAGQTLRSGSKAGLWFAYQRRLGIFNAFKTVLHDGFDSQCAGNLAMSFTAHPIRENIEVKRRDDAKAVFIVGAHHSHMGGTTGRNLQRHSPGRRAETTPRAP